MQSSQSQFVTYGTSHLVVIALLLLGAVVLVRAGRARAEPGRMRLSRALSVAIVAGTVPLQLLYLSPSHVDIQHTLPIQLCDVASMVAAYALWTHRPWATTLTYYWGLTLTSQAVILPSLSHAFPDPRFFLFWGMHVSIVWAAVFLTWGMGLRPTWRTYRTSFAITATWAVAVFCFNRVASTNYGYLNAKPDGPSTLDLLGGWPSYLLPEVVAVAAIWALITLPWVGGVRRMTRRQDRGGTRPVLSPVLSLPTTD
jgi:hypothetical integral membrane protein (TIGR02206 family)